jgi:uncharacterized protein YqjF (DUF2071 family)
MAAFLTAEWRYLAMLHYAVDPSLLVPFVPHGTELDEFAGTTYMSLVGFRFEHTRVHGLWIPFHSDFDEVNLRFYVRRTVGREVRRGVVFVREIVPRWAIAKVAQVCYGERYVALPMAHRISEPVSEGGTVNAEYRWRADGKWNVLRAEGKGRAETPPEQSREAFFTEHYWGYAASPSGAIEYRVEQDRWRAWPATSAGFMGDMSELYGSALAARLQNSPDCALIAEGSAVTVLPGQRI